MTHPIEKSLQYTFQDNHFLHNALTHPSKAPGAFQRLEFLGDRVLGLVIAEWLCEIYPDAEEGTLAKYLSVMVRKEALHTVAILWKLHRYMHHRELGILQSRILSDTCEAIIGAIFMDGGLQSVKQVIRRTWHGIIKTLGTHIHATDAKSLLQEYLQSQGKSIPAYHILTQEGPSHQPMFSVAVHIDTLTFTGTGSSRKKAEQEAARNALVFFEKNR